MIHKIRYNLFKLFRIHLTMPNCNPDIRYFTLYKLSQFINILNSIIHYKNLTIPTNLKINCIFYYLYIKRMNLCLDRISIWGRCVDCRKITRPHQRKLQSSWDWCCSHSECINIHLHLFQLFFSGNTKLLLLINHKKSKILKFNILTHNSMSTNKNINFTLLKIT